MAGGNFPRIYPRTEKKKEYNQEYINGTKQTRNPREVRGSQSFLNETGEGCRFFESRNATLRLPFRYLQSTASSGKVARVLRGPFILFASKWKFVTIHRI